MPAVPPVVAIAELPALLAVVVVAGVLVVVPVVALAPLPAAELVAGLPAVAVLLDVGVDDAAPLPPLPAVAALVVPVAGVPAVAV